MNVSTAVNNEDMKTIVDQPERTFLIAKLIQVLLEQISLFYFFFITLLFFRKFAFRLNTSLKASLVFFLLLITP